MTDESERIKEIKEYIESTIAEIDGHTENVEKLFKLDKWSKDKSLYEIIINSYERHRNTLKRIQKMIEGEKVESGLYTLSVQSEMDMIKERLDKLEGSMSDSIPSELLQKWINAIKTGDPKEVTNLYYDDGILLGTFSNKERIGHELILEYFENLLKSPVEVEIVSEHASISESVAVNSGLYNFVTDGKTINARFSFVYQKNNDEWKITSHHSSVIPESD
jgi:uncharacterized protein (TIGR02246 family)